MQALIADAVNASFASFASLPSSPMIAAALTCKF
jgi:hypothetical protein